MTTHVGCGSKSTWMIFKSDMQVTVKTASVNEWMNLKARL